jgi:hypothetical protein
MLQLKEVTEHLYLLTFGEKPIAAIFTLDNKPIIIAGDVEIIKPSQIIAAAIREGRNLIVGDMNE